MDFNTAQEPAHLAESLRVRWHNTLFFRVILLCGVLLLCLLASVYALTAYYFNEAAEEMRQRAEDISEMIVVKFEENPAQDLAALSDDIVSFAEGAEVQIQPFHETAPGMNVPHPTEAQTSASGSVYLEKDSTGQLNRVAYMLLPLGNQTVLMTLRVPIEPQVEVLRAFTNRYMLTLTAIFILTLALMVYFIRRTLRPLTQFSDTCAAISSGKLEQVTTARAYGEIHALENTFNHMVHALREKELVEAKLRQAQRLSALGNLAAGVAHDVRNPLNAIKLLSSHAIDTIEENGNGHARKSLQTIQQEVVRLESIVSSFLSLAKESELRPEVQRIDTLLEECVQLFTKDAEERGVRMVTELRAGSAELMIDPKHWKRAILNVLLNALEACPPGGRVRLFSRMTDRAVEIEIRDDGPGMPREVIDRVFDPYYTTKPGGTGLGLSITRGIVEEHGGAIELSSSEGQGVQVLITVPLKQQLPQGTP